MRRPAFLLVVVVLVSACGGGTDQPTSTTSTTPAVSTTDVGTATTVDTHEVPDAIMDAVLADAEGRSGTSLEELVVTRAEAVEWSDSSLGCPEPGKFYTQIITPGYQVEVETDEQVYDYRIDVQGSFRLCEDALGG